MAKLALKLDLVKMIDELGTIHEQLKKLIPREKEIKDVLKAYGPCVLDGKTFSAVNTPGKTTYYKTSLLEEHVSAALLKKCEATTAYLKVTTVRRESKIKLRAI